MRKIIIYITFLATLLTGCSVYRIDIQQGNTLELEDVEKLRVGMNTQQVIFLLGTPLLRDPFHEDRWDYIYTLRKGNEPMIQQRLTLYFEGESLIKIDKSDFEKSTLPRN